MNFTFTFDIATTLRTGRSGVRVQVGSEIFLFSKTFSRPAVGPSRPTNHWVPGSVSRVNRPRRVVDRSLMSSAEVKNEWSYTSFPPIRLHEDPRLLGCGDVNEAVQVPEV